MTTVQITLPDQLAQETKQAGLLSEAALEKLLREQLQAKCQDGFFTALERMPEPPAMSPEEMAEEIRAMREERRARAAG
jgi:hypothetical protein